MKIRKGKHEERYLYPSYWLAYFVEGIGVGILIGAALTWLSG